jgi:hypothetical protein
MHQNLCPGPRPPRRRAIELIGRHKDIDGFHVQLALSKKEQEGLIAGLRLVFRDAPVLNIHLTCPLERISRSPAREK